MTLYRRGNRLPAEEMVIIHCDETVGCLTYFLITGRSVGPKSRVLRKGGPTEYSEESVKLFEVPARASRVVSIVNESHIGLT